MAVFTRFVKQKGTSSENEHFRVNDNLRLLAIKKIESLFGETSEINAKIV